MWRRLYYAASPWVRANGSSFTCATNMPPPGREVQAERLGTLPASRARCKPLLYGVRSIEKRRVTTRYDPE